MIKELMKPPGEAERGGTAEPGEEEAHGGNLISVCKGRV